MSISLVFIGLAVLAELLWGGLGAAIADSIINRNPVNRFFNEIPKIKPQKANEIHIESGAATIIH